MLTVVVDYGMGNLRSVYKALLHVGFKNVEVSSDKNLIDKADIIVFPGVGAFKDAMRNLKESRIIDSLLEGIKREKPFLGICLGLQLLFEKSYEFGEEEGLGVFKGEVKLLPRGVKIPHMGWNQVWIKKERGLFKGIKNGSYFYFVHSYRVIPEEEDIVASTTDYGEYFVSAVEKDNIWAVQFHPEKSQKLGLKILENFKEFSNG